MKLKEMEKRTYHAYWSPWLWDIFLSGVLLMVGLFVGYNRGSDGLPGLIIFGVVMFSWVGLMKLVQARVVRPRVGEAVFGRKRRERKRWTVWVLWGSVLMGVLVWVLAPLLMGLGDRLSGGVWLLALFGLNAILIFSILGYFQDYANGYIWGWLFALAIPSVELGISEWGMHLPLAVITATLIMGSIGLTGMIRFLREYPRVDDTSELEINHDEAGGQS